MSVIRAGVVMLGNGGLHTGKAAVTGLFSFWIGPVCACLDSMLTLVCTVNRHSDSVIKVVKLLQGQWKGI
jgi:hypothetical protein